MRLHERGEHCKNSGRRKSGRAGLLVKARTSCGFASGNSHRRPLVKGNASRRATPKRSEAARPPVWTRPELITGL